MPVVRLIELDEPRACGRDFHGLLTACGFDTFRISTATTESIPYLSDWDHRPISDYYGSP
jgi:hypothetical protein